MAKLAQTPRLGSRAKLGHFFNTLAADFSNVPLPSSTTRRARPRVRFCIVETTLSAPLLCCFFR